MDNLLRRECDLSGSLDAGFIQRYARLETAVVDHNGLPPRYARVKGINLAGGITPPGCSLFDTHSLSMVQSEIESAGFWRQKRMRSRQPLSRSIESGFG
jgi:hypothetical protein